MRMRWPWRRQRYVGQHWHPPAPIPDGHIVRHLDGRDARQIIADMLGLDPPAVGRAPVPHTVAPLMTPGARWRARGGRR